eukprot:652125-Prorocentrum_minimum.AAC.2
MIYPRRNLFNSLTVAKPARLPGGKAVGSCSLYSHLKTATATRFNACCECTVYRLGVVVSWTFGSDQK